MLQLLAKAYGRPKWNSWGKALDVLVETILSQNTSNANSSAGYKQLRRAFANWNAAADAPVGEVERAIRVSGLSRIKAPRIQQILRQVRQRQRGDGDISLEYLAAMPPEEAFVHLMEFDGVGPKTAACVLLFSFHMPIFPVDTHIHRIAIRLGLLKADVSAVEAQEQLTPMIPPADRYAMHILLITHGRKVCKARNPQCSWCDLIDLCPHGQKIAAAQDGKE